MLLQHDDDFDPLMELLLRLDCDECEEIDDLVTDTDECELTDDLDSPLMELLLCEELELTDETEAV